MTFSSILGPLLFWRGYYPALLEALALLSSSSSFKRLPIGLSMPSRLPFFAWPPNFFFCSAAAYYGFWSSSTLSAYFSSSAFLLSSSPLSSFPAAPPWFFFFFLYCFFFKFFLCLAVSPSSGGYYWTFAGATASLTSGTVVGVTIVPAIFIFILRMMS
jgi:hypothetical protein